MSRQRHQLQIIASTLKRFGLEQCITDPSVMRLLMRGEVEAMVVIHVDNLSFGGADSVSHELVAALNHVFPIKILGELAGYMGSKYRWDRTAGVLEIPQNSLIRRVVD